MKKAHTGLSALAFLVLTACGQTTASAPPASPAPAASALAASVGAIALTEAWAAATPGNAGVGAGYFTITNNGDVADALVSVTSPRARSVELHEMTMNGDVMTMRALARLEIPAHGSVTLASGAHHLMFNDITTPFMVGEQIPVTLTFEHAGAVTVQLPVRSPHDAMSMH